MDIVGISITNLLSPLFTENEGIISNNKRLFSSGIDTVDTKFNTLNLGPYTYIKIALDTWLLSLVA